MQSENLNLPTACDLSNLQEKIDEAELYFTQGLFDEASQIYQRLLNNLEPLQENADADPALRRSYESHRGFMQEQLAVIERQKAEFHGHQVEAKAEKPATAPESEGSAAFNRAHAFLDIGLFSSAILEFQRAAEEGFRPVECSMQIGKAHIQLGKPKEGIRVLEEAYDQEDLHADDRRMLLGQMAISYEAAGYKDKALECHLKLADRDLEHLPATTEVESLTEENQGYQVKLEAQSQTSLTSQGEALLRLNVDPKLRYQILEEIGQDEIHQVFKAEEVPNGAIRIAKTLLPHISADTEVKDFIVEWAYEQVAMENRNIAQVLDVAESNGQYYLIMEGFQCTLEDVLQEETKLPLAEALQLARALLNSLAYAHSHRGTDDILRKIYHLALNPRRVVLNGPMTRAKIADFGLITQLSDMLTITPNYQDLSPYELAYMAPEQFERSPARMPGKMKQAADLYSFGLVFYRVVTGKVPFEGPSPEEFRQQHNEQYPVPPRVFLSSIPPMLDEAILKCIHKDSRKRWRTPTELDLALEKIHI